MLRSAVSGYIERIVDGRALRRRVSRNQDQSRHFGDVRVTSTFPPFAEVLQTSPHFAFGRVEDALASRASCITRGRGGWLNLPRGGLPPPILCQLSWRTPRWVNRVILTAGRAFPVYPN